MKARRFYCMALLTYLGVIPSLLAANSKSSLQVDPKIKEEAKKLESVYLSQVVQNRMVPRKGRFELILFGGQRLGGDAFLFTQSVGIKLGYHINHRIGLGLTYQDFGHQLSAQGRKTLSDINSGQIPRYFLVTDPMQNLTALSLEYYPVYGKLNFLGLKTIQFDVNLAGYLGLAKTYWIQAPYGGLQLGTAFWLNRHLTFRADYRYENYRWLDPIVSQKLTGNASFVSLGLGWLF